MTEQKANLPNVLVLENREKLTISGVSDVDSFDEKSVIAYTGYGQLTIQGSGLNIKSLSAETGELSIEGTVSALIYSDNRPQENIFKRIFR